MNTTSKIDAGKTMAEMWDGFAEMVIPFAPAGSSQHDQMRKAFYSGGLCLFNWFMVQLDEGSEPTAGDLDRVSAIHEEIEGFLTTLGSKVRVQ